MVTVSPAFTFTAVTVPAAEKLRSSVCAAATVPCADTVLVSAPRVTVTSCFVVVVAAASDEPSDRIAKNHTPKPTTTTTGTTIHGRRSRRYQTERVSTVSGVAGSRTRVRRARSATPSENVLQYSLKLFPHISAVMML